MNPGILRARGAILRAIRGWFDAHGYVEVPTDCIVRSPALEEHLEAVAVGPPVPREGAWFLRTSPEFALKRVLAAGLGRIYEIGPCFREEEAGDHHAREFLMLEWYRIGAGTAEMMDEVEVLVGEAAAAVGRERPVFRRLRVADLIHDREDRADWFQEWVDRVEPELRKEPTFVWGYPAWQAALARVVDSREGPVADRFEGFLGGLELCNCFAEETDPDELRGSFESSAELRRSAGRAPHPVDEALLAATPRMPRCAGVALGVDRLVMALVGADRIGDVRP